MCVDNAQEILTALIVDKQECKVKILKQKKKKKERRKTASVYQKKSDMWQ